MYHPDKNSTPEAGVLFQEIAEAYTALNDSSEKDNVDRYGDEVAYRDETEGIQARVLIFILRILLISLEHYLKVLIHSGILFMTCYLTICTINMDKLNHQILVFM